MTKRFIIIGCLLGAASVIIGAFGAHILKKILTESDLEIYKTGVEYQFYHTFAILITGILSRYTDKSWTNIAGWLFVAGTILFSGSLYLLAVAKSFELEAMTPLLGPMTPIGGLLFIGGWLSLLFAAIKYKHRSGSRQRHSST